MTKILIYIFNFEFAFALIRYFYVLRRSMILQALTGERHICFFFSISQFLNIVVESQNKIRCKIASVVFIISNLETILFRAGLIKIVACGKFVFGAPCPNFNEGFTDSRKKPLCYIHKIIRKKII